MLFTQILLTVAASTLVAGHGKVAVVTGDAGGNGTALGIQGGVIPGAGRNKVTEPDTTVFARTNIMTDGLGKTTGGGKNTGSDIVSTMAQSGDTLPQVTDGGLISGTWHTVTSDGAGPIAAVLDTTGTGAFSSGTMLKTVTQIPGKNGNIRPQKRSLWQRAVNTIARRAVNINTDEPMAFQMPTGATCTGSMGGQENVCLVKIANSNPAGPFGGVIAVQMAGAASNSTPAAAPAKAASAAGKKGKTAPQNRKRFSA